MKVEIKRKSKFLINRTGGRKGGGIVRLDEEACQAIKDLIERTGNVSVTTLTSELIKAAAKEAEIIFKD